MRVVNRTRGTVLGSHVQVANSVWSRLRGFLGRPEPAEGQGLLLAPCNAVHMYAMSYSLDVLFLDSTGRVIKAVEHLAPWRRTRRIRMARYVLEVRVGTIEATDTHTGDELAWMPARTVLPPGPGSKEPMHRRAPVPTRPSRRSEWPS